MFMDNDDWYYPEMCEVMYESITKEDVDVVTCRFVFDSTRPIREKSFLDAYDPVVKVGSVYEMPQLMTTTQPGFIWNKIFKKSFLEKFHIRFPNEILYEDIYFMIQVYLNASGILLLNDFWGYYYNVITEGKDKSLSDTFDEESLIKRLDGLKLILNMLSEAPGDFSSLKGEMIVGWTKLFIYTNPKDKRSILKSAEEPLAQYPWNMRITVISLP